MKDHEDILFHRFVYIAQKFKCNLQCSGEKKNWRIKQNKGYLQAEKNMWEVIQFDLYFQVRLCYLPVRAGKIAVTNVHMPLSLSG